MDAIDKFKRKCEEEDRVCDALVLAYNPQEFLAGSYERNFYIPSGDEVEEAFGEALRKIFGEKEGASHWADAVKWGRIKNLDGLDERIREGVSEVFSGDSDYATLFDNYFSSLNGRFEHTWIYLRGDFYRFVYGKREEAIEKFNVFWNAPEKSRWNEIHRFMREYTKK